MASHFNLRILPHRQAVTNKVNSTAYDKKTEKDNFELTVMDMDNTGKDTVASTAISIPSRDTGYGTECSSSLYTDRSLSSKSIIGENEEDEFEIVSFKSALSTAIENLEDNDYTFESLSAKHSPGARFIKGSSDGFGNNCTAKHMSQSYPMDQNIASRTPCNSPTTVPEGSIMSVKAIKAITHTDRTKRNAHVDASLTPQFSRNFYQKLAENELKHK